MGRLVCAYPCMNAVRAQVYLTMPMPRCQHGISEHVNICVDECESLCNMTLPVYKNEYRKMSVN